MGTDRRTVARIENQLKVKYILWAIQRQDQNFNCISPFTPSFAASAVRAYLRNALILAILTIVIIPCKRNTVELMTGWSFRWFGY